MISEVKCLYISRNSIPVAFHPSIFSSRRSRISSSSWLITFLILAFLWSISWFIVPVLALRFRRRFWKIIFSTSRSTPACIRTTFSSLTRSNTMKLPPPMLSFSCCFWKRGGRSTYLLLWPTHQHLAHKRVMTPFHGLEISWIVTYPFDFKRRDFLLSPLLVIILFLQH